MSKTTILTFHPDLQASRANAALLRAASAIDGVEQVDMQALYPGGTVDADAEAARLLGAGRIVLQFPLQWYSTPPLLKSWQDSVLTRMYYLRYEEEGRKLEGTPLMVAATAGNTPENYSAHGSAGFTLAELLRPLQATAHRCLLPWAEPFLLYRANQLDDAALEAAGEAYAAHLRRWEA
jgi:putative NADPH-quinone reductase